MTHARQDAAQERLDELTEVYESAGRVVRDLIRRAEEGDAEAARKLPSQLATLQELFVKIRKGEESFHEKFGHDGAGADEDFDALRDRIGRQLDRLRNA